MAILELRGRMEMVKKSEKARRRIGAGSVWVLGTECWFEVAAECVPECYRSAIGFQTGSGLMLSCTVSQRGRVNGGRMECCSV